MEKQKTNTIEHAVEELNRYLSGEFGQRNDSIDRGNECLGTFIRSSREILPIQQLPCWLAEGLIDKELARTLLGGLGMIASALARHSYGTPSEAHPLIQIPGLEQALLVLGGIAEQVPRDNHKTYWRENPEPSIRTFTEHPGEKYFINTARSADITLSKSANLMSSIRSGDLSLRDHVTSDLLAKAGADLKRLWSLYCQFHAELPKGFFANRMRQYLLPYVVGERSYNGPNATNFDAFPRLDISFGIVEDWYIEAINERFPYYESAEIARLNNERRLPSVDEALLGELGLSTTHRPSIQALASTLAEKCNPLFDSVQHLAGIAQTYRQISGIHSGQIRGQLVQVEKHMTDDERSSLPVCAEQGVSGATLQRTFDINKLRGEAWLTTVLPKAATLIKTEREL